MDKKNGKSYENKSGENQSIDKTDTVAIPNGVVTNNSGYITNGYMAKEQIMMVVDLRADIPLLKKGKLGAIVPRVVKTLI